MTVSSNALGITFPYITCRVYSRVVIRIKGESLAVPATSPAVIDDLVLDDALALVVPAIIARAMAVVAVAVVVVITEIVVVARVFALPLDLANAVLASLANLVGKLNAAKNILLFTRLVTGPQHVVQLGGNLHSEGTA